MKIECINCGTILDTETQNDCPDCGYPLELGEEIEE